MKTHQLLAILIPTLLLAATPFRLTGAEECADCASKSSLDAADVLRKIELNVATKQYEKVLTAAYEADLELNLGPTGNELTPNEEKRWLQRAENKRAVLAKMAERLRLQIREWVEKENAISAANAAKSQTRVEPDGSLQGTWEGVEIGREADGKCAVTITGDSIHFQGSNRNEWYKATFTLPAGSNPKQLIATITDCPRPEFDGKVSLAIYKIEGGKLTLTGHAPGDAEAPKSFEGDATSRAFVFTRASLQK